MKMGGDEMTQKILTVTLEIIYLLTGQDYGPINKSTQHGGRSEIRRTTAQPLPSSQRNLKRILDLTNKIIELLMREEWEYLGHKDLYRDVMMQTQPSLTSPDGSSKRITLKRRLSPDDPRESTGSSHSIPQDYQVESLKAIKVEAEETEVEEDEPCKEEEEEEETPTDISTDGSSKKNTSERRSSPDDPPQSRQESHSFPKDEQVGSLKLVKGEVEETEDWGDKSYQMETPTYVYPGASSMSIRSKGCCSLDDPQESAEERHRVLEEDQDESLRIIKVEAKECQPPIVIYTHARTVVKASHLNQS
ncbi:gastrula zinc finger protein XlCGF66.1-like isoform X2 [Bufo gargarizans]|uniref:gastrula zinc finger protein XlCGF66.1-like isoform X2 n=1 Tax=Bufo gargarizans TaxID=30331 RepID=UPI001CF3EC39|nr:gastrula zinc finger protein XlCGF66.1-like isoform X2 [Bufo gargarizans]